MKILEGAKKIRVAVVCCQHGDELIGEQVFAYYDHARLPDGLRLIFANEQANVAGKRFIDTDLNRSFPGDEQGSHEEQLAAQIMPYIQDVNYVLDLHTTTSDVVMTPIVASLNDQVKQILNLTSSKEVAYMGPEIAKPSLIGQVQSGVSLEYNQDYAKTKAAFDEVIEVINALLEGRQHAKQDRTIYEVSGVVPLDVELPEDTKNFEMSEAASGYPFLLHEKSYTTHQGFLAKELRRATI